ncbi:MAG: hypothetical protein ACE5II_06100, partial [Anaerolineae bacterium]
MKGKLFLAVLILALLVQAIGCAPAATPTPAREVYLEAEVPRLPAPTPPPIPAAEKAAGAAVPPAEERLIVKTGNISLLVENTEESLTKIEA